MEVAQLELVCDELDDALGRSVVGLAVVEQDGHTDL